jgi:hypothetical protein
MSHTSPLSACVVATHCSSSNCCRCLGVDAINMPCTECSLSCQNHLSSQEGKNIQSKTALHRVCAAQQVSPRTFSAGIGLLLQEKPNQQKINGALLTRQNTTALQPCTSHIQGLHHTGPCTCAINSSKAPRRAQEHHPLVLTLFKCQPAQSPLLTQTCTLSSRKQATRSSQRVSQQPYTNAHESPRAHSGQPTAPSSPPHQLHQ